MHWPLVLIPSDSLLNYGIGPVDVAQASFGSIRNRNVTHSGGAIVVVQHSAQALAAMDDACFAKMFRFWAD
jgi:hypothetical protein